MTQPLYTVRQLAYVVTDMDAALKYWVDVLKVGPFFVYEHCPLENQRYLGQPSNVDVTLALGNSGDLQIELIFQHDQTPSVYKEFLDAGRVGVRRRAPRVGEHNREILGGELGLNDRDLARLTELGAI